MLFSILLFHWVILFFNLTNSLGDMQGQSKLFTGKEYFALSCIFRKFASHFLTNSSVRRKIVSLLQKADTQNALRVRAVA